MLQDSICAYVNSWLLQRGNWGWSKPCHDTILARLNTQFPGNFMAKPDLGRVGSWPGGHRGCRSFRKSTATMRHGGRTSGFFHLGCGWSQQSSRLPSHGGGDEDFEVYFREDGWQGWPAANALDGTRRIGNPKCLQCWNFVCGTSGSLWAAPSWGSSRAATRRSLWRRASKAVMRWRAWSGVEWGGYVHVFLFCFCVTMFFFLVDDDDDDFSSWILWMIYSWWVDPKHSILISSQLGVIIIQR